MPIEIRHDLSGAGIEGAIQAGRAEALAQARALDIRQMAAQADQMNAMARNSAAQQQSIDEADNRTNRSMIAGGEIAARYDLHALDQEAQAERDQRIQGFELQRDEIRGQRAEEHDARSFEQQRQMRLLQEGAPLTPGEERRQMVLQSSMDSIRDRVNRGEITEREAEPLRMKIDQELTPLQQRRQAAVQRQMREAQVIRNQDFESRRMTWTDGNGEQVQGYRNHNGDLTPLPSNRPVMSAADFARIRTDIATSLRGPNGEEASPERVQAAMQQFMNDWNSYSRPGRQNNNGGGGQAPEMGTMIGQILTEMNATPPGDIATAGQVARAGLAANQQARPILQSMQQIINNPNPTPEQWMELRNLGLSLPPGLRQRIGIPNPPPPSAISNWGEEEPNQPAGPGVAGAGQGTLGGMSNQMYQESMQRINNPQPEWRGINENYLNQPGENQTSPTHSAYVMRAIDAALSSAQQASAVDREQLRELRRVVPYWGPIIDPKGARIMTNAILSRMEDRDLAARLERLLLRSQ